MLIITRNQTDYGPYDEYTVSRFVEEGKLLLNDKARDTDTGQQDTIKTFLDRAGIHPRIKHNGTLTEQLGSIGSEFIFPREEISRHSLLEDKRLLVLAVVGLSLSVIMLLPIGGFLVFYVVSLYFSVIWGLFFYYFFRTRQVNVKTTVTTFFLTQLAVFVIFSGLNSLNFFYVFTNAPFPLSIIGYIAGVGLTEEFAKMIPLLILAHRAKEPLLPQTLVYYGLMSGIAFGVFEGVQYQTTVNTQADYTTAFVLNIARLTSLPFLHATFSGICGYFTAFARLYPKYRRSLYALALAVPATLHGLYDAFATFFYPLALATALFTVLLLMAYLRRSATFQARLRN